ncbi:MAG: DUF2935 domain-containing protein [Clostridia bacterium]
MKGIKMMDKNKYIVQSLELHLFFARIMKEHSLFLEAGFTPPNASFAKKAEWFKLQFEKLLAETVQLAQNTVRQKVLDSGEVITEFTLNAERQTAQFTGIGIDTNITRNTARLKGRRDFHNPNSLLYSRVSMLNRTAMRLLNALIEFKESILKNVRSCNMFTMNYPLLIEHILREAKLYRSFVTELENGTFCDTCMKDTERFWNRIMMEHAMFIRGLLDPSENALIDTADSFAEEYDSLLKSARTQNDLTLSDLKQSSLEETLRFRDFKQAGAMGIQNCSIESVILPLLADHVLREANHYIRLLESAD